MKKLPQRIWVDADSCWTEKPQGEGYVEYVHEDYHAKAMLCAFHRGIEKGEKKMLNKVCKWLEEHLANFFGESYIYEEPDTLDRCLKSMKKAMKEE